MESWFTHYPNRRRNRIFKCNPILNTTPFLAVRVTFKNLSKVKLGSVIGSGGFGKVHRAVINPAGRASYEAAVKIPHHQGDNDLKQEALIFNLLQHTNILRFVFYPHHQSSPSTRVSARRFF